MNEHVTENDMYWVTSLVSNNVVRIGYLALALFIGHRSFGLPDYGIGVWHLFAVGIGGPFVIWITMVVEGWRVDRQITRGLRSAGFTDDEIDDLPPL